MENAPINEKAITAQPAAMTHDQLRQLVESHVAGSGHAWNNGLCSCGFANCVKGIYCLPCMACGVASSLGEWKCLPYCCHPMISIPLLRAKMRTMLGIRGSLYGDICCTQYCLPCVVCQMHGQLHHLGLDEHKPHSDHTCLCE